MIEKLMLWIIGIIAFYWMIEHLVKMCFQILVRQSLDKIEKHLKEKYDHVFVVEMDQLKADWYAELIALLREIRQL